MLLGLRAGQNLLWSRVALPSQETRGETDTIA